MQRIVISALLVASFVALDAAADPAARSPREALQPFNLLVGSWRGAGIPEGTREERQIGHWTETIDCEWQFKGNDAWLTVRFDKGKHFAKGELRWLPDNDQFRFAVDTADKKTVTFTGALKDKQLTLERTDADRKETQRLTFSLLHPNRVLYRYDVKPEGKTFFTKLYQVGATKEGVPFAEIGAPEKECVVSGGTGTTSVTYMGKTYYVCCSGCRDEFKENPAKYVAEFEKKRAEKAKKDGK